MGAVRLYGSYALARDTVIYDLVMLTYVEVFLLYAGQVFVWQTAKGRDTVVPFVISTVGVVWMLVQRDRSDEERCTNEERASLEA